MARIPENILRHRQPGTEIKMVGGKYYMQRITCKWIPEKKQRKKILAPPVPAADTVTESPACFRRARNSPGRKSSGSSKAASSVERYPGVLTCAYRYREKPMASWA